MTAAQPSQQQREMRGAGDLTTTTSTVSAEVSPGAGVDRDGALPGDFESRATASDSVYPQTADSAPVGDSPRSRVHVHRTASPPVRLTRHGALLRAFRIRAGFSQNELARATGLNQALVNKIERFGKFVSRPTLLVLTNALLLNDDDRDRLLFAAGHAPVRDFQAILDAVLNRLTVMRQEVAS